MTFKAKKFSNSEGAPEYDQEILRLMREIYPKATSEQLIEGRQNLEEYLETAWKIAERLVREEESCSFDNDSKNFYPENTKVEP
jgi:hypothetical protein